MYHEVAAQLTNPLAAGFLVVALYFELLNITTNSFVGKAKRLNN